MTEQYDNHLQHNLTKRKLIAGIGSAIVGVSSLAACSHGVDAECGQTVELDLNQTPNAFIEIDEHPYSLYVDDTRGVRRVRISEGKTLREQRDNATQGVELVGEGTTQSASIEINGIQVSFISAVGRDTLETNCKETTSTLH